MSEKYFLQDLPGNRIRVKVNPDEKTGFIPFRTCDTFYNSELISKIFQLKGINWMCDEIRREEDPDNVKKHLWFSLHAYIPRENFAGKEILDFGCGSGASSIILAKYFPCAKITGVDLSSEMIELAEKRKDFHKLKNLHFKLSPSPDKLPDLKKYDYIILSAVFEHLLPEERKKLLILLWSFLKPEGILWINQTPQRWFFWENHTTGLPLINYLPDSMALWVVNQIQPRNIKNPNWKSLLREGIRGGSIGEIKKILEFSKVKFELLKPNRLGIKDSIDLWYKETSKTRFLKCKRLYYTFMKWIKFLTKREFLPNISIAIQKKN